MTKKAKIKKELAGEKSSDAKTLRSHSLPCIWPFMGLGLAGIIFVLDQLSKWIVLNHLMVPPQNLRVTSFLNIILAWNRGVSFGLLSSNNPYGVWILASIAFAFAFVLIAWIWRSDSKMLAIAFGMVLGGAVGNLIDRLRFGAVTDFLDFHVHGYHWYTFNIADIGIVVGVGLVIIEHLKEMWFQK
jgi:signal peptidase II